ncbi:MAG: DUF1232 domain-containing protein [Bacteroidaceae bacterium]|nr:DUF1232 domain-containing protein [Bacteroidaceae bacterium]
MKNYGKEVEKHKKDFSEEGMWNKLAKYAKTAGRELVENVLILWYAFPDASATDKAIILGAIGYFISPIDAIPDLMPIVGYSDDVGVVAWAVARIRMHASSSAIEKAKRKANEYFS